MEFNLEELKAQLGSDTISESITDDTLIKIKLMVEGFVTAKTTELQEQLESKTAEVELVKEKAEQWGDLLKEQADKYGEHIKEKAQSYGDEIADKAQSYGDYLTEQLSDKVESYAEYVVEEFISENKEKFVEQREYNKMKQVFETIKESFEANMFPLNENSQANKLSNKLQESKDAYGKLFKETQNLKKYAIYVERQQILEDLAYGLSDTQKEKIEKLTENFSDIEQYKTSINILVSDLKNKPTLTERVEQTTQRQVVKEQTVSSGSDMSMYLDYMAKTTTQNL